MNNEEINIWWEGPFKIDDIINGIKKYQKLHPDLIMMAALDLGILHD